MGSIFLLSVIATLLLGNQMSAEEFGEFALLKSFIIIGGSFSLLGMDQVIIKKGPNFNLPYKLIINIWFILFISSFFFTAIFKIIFLFRAKEFLFLWVIIFSNANFIYLAALFRVRHQFILSQLYYNFWKVLLFCCSILLIIFYDSPLFAKDLYYLLGLLSCLSFILLGTYIFISFKDKIKLKFNRNIKGFITQGFVFWIISVVSLFFSGLDRFLITKFSSKIVLGEYHAITFIFITGFSMLGSTIGYVLYPYLVNKKNINIKYLLLLYLILCMFIYIIFISWGEIIFSLAYNANYDYIITKKLISIILLIGIIQGLHTIVHFIVYAYASPGQLGLYFKLTILVCLIYIISFYSSTYIFDLTLFSISYVVLSIWVLKLLTLVGLLIYILKIKSLSFNEA